MKIELIGIIITPLITLLASVCGLIVNALIQRRNNSITHPSLRNLGTGNAENRIS